MKNKYYSLVKNEAENSADIYIYGDITSWEWLESDVSSYTLSKEIAGLDVASINVYINSYGGEVAEGLAIYNQLKRHNAKVITYCDGFACSAASIVFMAGDERIMSASSLLMIHNVWAWASGNANDLRKQADDLEKITQPSISAYMEKVNITEDELKTLLDEETWILPQEALDMEFATSITNYTPVNKASQNAKQALFKAILSSKVDNAKPKADPEEEQEPQEPQQTPEEDKPFSNFFQAFKSGKE